MKTLAAALIASSVSGAIASAQGQLWIVDDGAGPGVDFNNLQAAIDAASDDDTLFVQAGSHGDAVIDAKSLVVVGLPGGALPVARVGSLTVRNLSVDQSVVLRELFATHLVFETNTGTIWGERLRATDAALVFFGGATAPALEVRDCAAVVLQRCDLAGGPGVGLAYSAIQSTSSHLYVFDSSISSGPYVSGTLSLGSPGGVGLDLVGGSLFVAGGFIRGGAGGDGELCSPGGTGGPGLRLSGASPEARRLETILLGGNGGCSLFCPGLCASSGPPSLVLAGTLTALTGSARHYQLSSPASGGSPPQVQYQGQGGDLVLAALSLGAQPALALGLNGALLVPLPPLVLLVHGSADPLGALSFTLGVPTIPPGFAITAYLQAGAVATDGSVWLAAASALTLVH